MRIIDTHTHGIGGYDTRTSDVDHILRIAEIHGSYEVSEILLTIYPSAIRVMRENMETITRAMEKQEIRLNYPINRSQFQPQASGNPPIHPLERGGKGGFKKEGREGITQPAKIIGVHLEGPFLNPAKCGALNAMAFIEPAEYAFDKLIEGFESIVRIISVAPEMSGAVGLIKKMSDKGIIVSMGHSDATYAEADAGFHAGAKGITHIFNAMRSLHHREPGIAGFALLNGDIYIEVIADPFHLHPKTLDLIFRTKDPDKIIIISDAVKETKADGSKERGISDTYGNLLGGSLTIAESSNRLIAMGHNEEVIKSCITTTPGVYLSAR
jgi:N-acetylglucosamine-6-phosphate deacetylase